MGININIKEFTDEVTLKDLGNDSFKHNFVVEGKGIFDTLMDTATKHLKAQFESNRMRDEDYANVYAQVYQTTLQTALEIWLKKGIAEEQLKLLEKQMQAEDAKKDLYKRQIQGFDEDYKQKILKICLDSWGLGFSVAKDAANFKDIPQAMTARAINRIFAEAVFPDIDKGSGDFDIYS